VEEGTRPHLLGKDTLHRHGIPGFKDIYKQAGVHASYGIIASRAGLTLSESLSQALESKAPLIQIATWNDYGEGTMIEPTRTTASDISKNCRAAAIRRSAPPGHALPAPQTWRRCCEA